ncbi:MAG TPA: diaminopimelate epimerase [Spirochaetia bacterium]|nr:diaminopimelate epimerase [Spirochaetia bacterium]
MEIEFLKMQASGDDSILVRTTHLAPGAEPLLPAIAQRILDRSFGVGGNALLLLGPTEQDEVVVRSFDPQGGEPALSFHAIRCIARYASDSGAAHRADFVMRTAEGPIRVQIIDSSNVRVDMGMPMSSEMRTEIRESPNDSYTRSLLVDGRSLSYTPISLDRPYAIFFVPDLAFPINRTARKIAEQPEFPAGTGIGFVKVYSTDEIRLRTWDGGYEKDECACAAAALVASVVQGFTDREVFIHLKGGDVFLQWEETDNHLWLTGPAVYVFTGTYDFEEPEKE